MKKSLFFALAVVGMLSSCSSEDAIVGGADNAGDGLVPIKLGISNSAVVTRGTGTVGGVINESTGEVVKTNSWMGQSINVYMVNANTTNAAKFKSDDTKPMYDNAVLKTLESGIAKFADGTVNYYPTSGRYDFWAYRTDGAEGINKPTAANGEAESVKVDFTIDGSQDVMVAKTVLSEEDVNSLNGNTDAVYSAYSAHLGVQPTLKFEHLLSRLTFAVKGGPMVDENTGVKVAKIGIESMTDGTLTIIPASGKEQGIEWKEGKGIVYLKQRIDKDNYTDNLVELKETLPSIGDEAPVELGEALLVAPDNEYRIIVYLVQEVETNDITNEKEFKSATYETVLRTNSEEEFLAGHSYNVIITVHGLQKIDVNAELTPWVEDGNSEIEIEPENEY